MLVFKVGWFVLISLVALHVLAHLILFLLLFELQLHSDQRAAAWLSGIHGSVLYSSVRLCGSLTVFHTLEVLLFCFCYV